MRYSFDGQNSANLTSYHTNINGNPARIYIHTDKSPQLASTSDKLYDTSDNNVGHFFSNNHTLLFFQKHESGGGSAQSFTCYLMDKGEVPYFVIYPQAHDLTFITSVGDNAQCISVPFFHDDGMSKFESRSYELVTITPFQDPTQGFSLVYKMNLSFSDVKHEFHQKIFVKALFDGEEPQYGQPDTVDFETQTIQWEHEYEKNPTPKMIDLTVWSPTLSSQQNAERELAVNRLAQSKSQLMAHLYADGTFRLTKAHKSQPGVVTVWPTQGWACHTKNHWFIVVNQLHRHVISLIDRDLFMELPEGSAKSRPYVDVETNEHSDMLTVTYEGMSEFSGPLLSITDLVASHDFTTQQRGQSITGRWLGKVKYGSQHAHITVWPNLDINTLPDKNKKQEDNTTANEYGDVFGHCYPVNKIIHLKEKLSIFASWSSQHEPYSVPGTFFEDTQYGVNTAAIICILDKSRIADEYKPEESFDWEQAIYVMPDRGFSLDINLLKPIERGYTSIQFLSDSLVIHYPEKTISHRFTDLIHAKRLALMEKHCKQVILAELPFSWNIQLRADHRSQKHIVMIHVWEDVHNELAPFERLVENFAKAQAASSLNQPIESIHVAHFNTPSCTAKKMFWIANRADNTQSCNVIGSAWLLDHNTKPVIIVKSEYTLFCVRVTKDTVAKTKRLFLDDLFQGGAAFIGIDNIHLGTDNRVTIRYFDNRRAYQEDEQTDDKIVMSFDEFLAKFADRPSTYRAPVPDTSDSDDDNDAKSSEKPTLTA